MSLCSRCENFDVQAFARNQFAYRGYKLTAFLQAADAGCSFCSLALAYLKAVDNSGRLTFLDVALREASEEQPPLFSSQSLQRLELWLRSIRATVWVNFSVVRGDDLPNEYSDALNITELRINVSPYTSHYHNGQTNAVSFHTAADEGTPAFVSRDITGHVSTDTYIWSQSHLQSIKRWHRHCLKNHPECRQTLSGTQSFDVHEAQLPTRCLELVQNAQGDGSPISLTLRDTAGERGRYIILSHRWGDDTFAARTLTSNLRCRKKQCPPDCTIHHATFTTLFMQAAIIAKALDVNYIWIDSICIVQDDPEDWRRESTKMADYYQLAWLTLSTPYLDSHGGVFSILPNNGIERIARLPYRNPRGEQQGFFYLQCVQQGRLDIDYAQQVSQSKLLKRGWVYQEWLLSRRLLVTSGSGLFVQCQRSAPKNLLGDDVRREVGDDVGRETGDDVRREVGADDEATEKKLESPKDLAFKEALGLDLSSKSAIVASWVGIIETYSGLELTRLREDRLIALGGIAQEFGKALLEQEKKTNLASNDGGTTEVAIGASVRKHLYIGGNWFGYTRGLMWEQVIPGKRRRVEGFPTWSWASMASTMEDEKGQEVLTGMSVRWASANSNTHEMCSMVDARTIRVDDTFRPILHDPIIDPPENEYDKSHRFVMLGMRGKMMQVQIHASFDSKGDRQAAAYLTAYQSDFGIDMWRRVTTVKRPGIIIGWASVEHPDYQSVEALQTLHCLEGNNIYALVVSRIKKVKGGYGFGNWLNYQTAHTVLFLKSINISGLSNCFERVGIGRLFGNEVEDELEQMAVPNEVVWLI